MNHAFDLPSDSSGGAGSPRRDVSAALLQTSTLRHARALESGPDDGPSTQESVPCERVRPRGARAVEEGAVATPHLLPAEEAKRTVSDRDQEPVRLSVTECCGHVNPGGMVRAG